jgi:hypothetical protein
MTVKRCVGRPKNPTQTIKLVVYIPLEVDSELRAYAERFEETLSAVVSSAIRRTYIISGLKYQRDKEREQELQLPIPFPHDAK